MKYDPTTDPANASFKGQMPPAYVDWPARPRTFGTKLSIPAHSYLPFFHGQNPQMEPGNRGYDETKLKEIRNYVSVRKADLASALHTEDSDFVSGFLNGIKERGVEVPYFESNAFEALNQITLDFLRYLEEVLKKGNLEVRASQ